MSLIKPSSGKFNKGSKATRMGLITLSVGMLDQLQSVGLACRVKGRGPLGA